MLTYLIIISEDLNIYIFITLNMMVRKKIIFNHAND